MSSEGAPTWTSGYGVGEGWNLQGTLLYESSENAFVLFDSAIGENANSLHIIATRPGGTTIGSVDCPSIGNAVTTDLVGLGKGQFLLSAGTPQSVNSEGAGWLVKIQHDDSCVWVRQVEGPGAGSAVAAVEDSYGRFLVCGSALPPETQTRDIYVAAFDQSGKQLRYRTYGGGTPDFATEMVATEDGGVVLVGTSVDYGGDSGILALNIGPGGEALWAEVLGGPHDAGVSIHRTSDGGFLIGANCGPDDSEGKSVRIIKLSSDTP